MATQAHCTTLIRNATVYDGTGSSGFIADLAIEDDRIAAVGLGLTHRAEHNVDATGLALAPGFIDTHTHDDIAVLTPALMLPKLSQGVTTVVTGNCGISAAPFRPRTLLPDPMQLLGAPAGLRYPTFHAYVDALKGAPLSVNVAALVGHTALRSNHLATLDRAATPTEIQAMRAQLSEALDHGALGLSTGLAYLSAIAATTEEVVALAAPLAAAGAVYTTHIRSETEAILAAIDEACTVGEQAGVRVVISHLKCAGLANWGRSAEVLAALDRARTQLPVGWDCYPYAAGSSTLDLRQVDERVTVQITWCEPYPHVAGRTLASIAEEWRLPHLEAARRLQPAGAIYHSISEQDMRAILAHPATMIGSDGLPHDPNPHPRLWGTFPRVLGRYVRDAALFTLPEAIRKMTSLPAERFGFQQRGALAPGNYADLVLFDPAHILDTATYDEPAQPAVGIAGVWVNGELSHAQGNPVGRASGRFLPRALAV